MSIFAWFGRTPPDSVTADTRAWLDRQEQERGASDRAQLLAAAVANSDLRGKLRDANRRYGHASATIGALRGDLARLRAQLSTTAFVPVISFNPAPERATDSLQRRIELLARMEAQGRGDDPIAAAIRRHPSGAVLAYPRCDHDVVALPPQTICDECETEVEVRVDPADTAKVGDSDPVGFSTAPAGCPATIDGDGERGRWWCTRDDGHRGQHVAGGGSVHAVWPNKADADAALVATAEHLGDEIGQRDRTAAIEGAAITLRAHVYSPVHRDTACCCGWDAVQGNHSHTPPQGEAREAMHARHVAEQLAAVGALGTFAPVATPPAPRPTVATTPPDLIDKDGDLWRWHAGYAQGNRLPGVLPRAFLDTSVGPLTEAEQSEDVPW